jgi:hypothetical protein
LAAILAENRQGWRLTQRETVDTFIEYLVKRTKLRRETVNLPYRKETRYTWGEVPTYELLQTIRPNAYFSHFTAMHFHELTDQVPKTVFVNDEQTPKPAPMSALNQDAIDRAFQRPTLKSSNFATLRGLRVTVLSGKHTGALGVIDLQAPDGSSVRATGIERTLIDITVRPNYAGGVFEVLQAFRAAHDRVSVNRVAAFLKKMAFVYPYHQAIGFYLERAGAYRASQLDLFRKAPFEFDFYLAHNLGKHDYSKEWRLFYPAGF